MHILPFQRIQFKMFPGEHVPNPLVDISLPPPPQIFATGACCRGHITTLILSDIRNFIYSLYNPGLVLIAFNYWKVSIFISLTAWRQCTSNQEKACTEFKNSGCVLLKSSKFACRCKPGYFGRAVKGSQCMSPGK